MRSPGTRALQEPASGAIAPRVVTLALTSATVRYWMFLALPVSRQMKEWQRHADEIVDPLVRSLALEKLRGERLNAEAAALAATRAPASRRRHAVRAIIAVELMFDYLDGLTELPLPDPLADAERLYVPFLALFDASIGGSTEADDPKAAGARPSDPYVARLALAARGALAELPAYDAVAESAARCARRGAQAQARMHAAGSVGADQLMDWARSQAEAYPFSQTLSPSLGTGGAPAAPAPALGWRELLAACACSVLSIHALIAAAADPRTSAHEAQLIERAYMPLCATVTLLDAVVDACSDETAGRLSYISFYEHEQELLDALSASMRLARDACLQLRDGERHLALLAGAIAYQLTAAETGSALRRQVLRSLRDQDGDLLEPAMLIAHVWRVSRGLTQCERAKRKPKERRSR